MEPLILPFKCNHWSSPDTDIRFPLDANYPTCCELCSKITELVATVIIPDPRYGHCELAFEVHFEDSKSRATRVFFLRDPKTHASLYSIKFRFEIYAHPGILPGRPPARMSAQTRTVVNELLFYADTPCPWGLLRSYPFLDLGFADDRLAHCRKSHDCFSEQKSPYFPTRVISVGEDSEDIHLVDGGGIRDRYICLSHCWGSKQPLTTTRGNLDDHRKQIPWECIPVLYQDTIRLAWRYDIKYVWIDSICILQGDEEDWAREAGRMKDVYGNSFLTIAASSIENCSHNLLERSADSHGSFGHFIPWGGITRKRPFKWVTLPYHLRRSQDCYSCLRPESRVERCAAPLTKRAWVLQEHLLSPRELSFAAQRLFWDCRHARSPSDGYGRDPPAHSRFTNSPKRFHMALQRNHSHFTSDLWWDIIEIFSRLQITNEKDRLPALSGLAEAYGAMSDTKYLAGVWESDLPRSLTWIRSNERRRGKGFRNAKPASLSRSDHDSWHTPSWSWSSVSGGVEFLRLKPWAKTYVSLRGAECELSSFENPWGNVKQGKLNVSGPISSLNVAEQQKDSKDTEFYYYYDVEDWTEKSLECLVLGMQTYASNWDKKECNGLEPWNHKAILFIDIYGLLLEAVDSDTATYRRVGLLHYRFNGVGPYAVDETGEGVWWYQRTTERFQRDITIV